MIVKIIMLVTQVRDHIPLEQGLRQGITGKVNSQTYCQRPYSIRTRIKTGRDITPPDANFWSETIFH